MEQFFSELVQDIVAYFIAHRVISFLTFIIGSGVLYGILKKWWDPVASTVFYAIVGGGVIFICMWLVTQSDRQFANDRASRPYFSHSQGKIYQLSKVGQVLTVSVQNNDTLAQDVVTQLIVLEESLDPTKGPIHIKEIKNANPVGPSEILYQHWGPIEAKLLGQPAFVVFQIRYTDTLTNETYSQSFFLKFLGTTKDGTFINQLMNANTYEKARMERYINEPRISTL